MSKVKLTVRQIVNAAKRACTGDIQGIEFESVLAASGVIAVGISRSPVEAVTLMTTGWEKKDYFIDGSDYLYYRGMPR